jgi:hypothetical protein
MAGDYATGSRRWQNTRVLEYFLAWGRAALATVLAMLPRRYWPALAPIAPVERYAFAAGLVTFLAGMAVGIPGFLAHLIEQVSLTNQVLVNHVDPEKINRNMMWGLSGLSFFTFMFLTPQGWVTQYLGLTGFVRAAGAAFDDPHGDAILTLLDAGVRRLWTAAIRRGEQENRELLEGPDGPDRIARGTHLGMDAALVVVSVRRKGWDLGTVLVSDDGAHRVVAVEDRTINGNLRHLYGVNPHEDLEAIRRGVAYPVDLSTYRGIGRSRIDRSEDRRIDR